MSSVTLIFPHQLFAEHPALAQGREVILVEEFLFFRQYRFHKQKLVFHRASMRAYQQYLTEKSYAASYIEANEEIADIRGLVSDLFKRGVKEIHCCSVTDDWLGRRLEKASDACGIKLHLYESQLFLTQRAELDSYFKERQKYFQTDFYVWQRKHRKIMVDAKLKPIGGKWSFDADNRLRYPKGQKPPRVKFPVENSWVKEGRSYVAARFPENYGSAEGATIYPTTFAESREWLQQFLKSRFEDFGSYEDAIVAKESILHHSLLTPMLNVGLLTPAIIVEETLAYAARHDIPINSCEGFIRQVIGWREFIRGVYEYKGRVERTKNFWQFKRKIPKSFWEGSTGIPPLDTVIRRVLETGYCHHIERLMVLGNFMLLCEFDPDEVYRWFMEMFIDAYDWVMVPNVYGMSQFADGGLMATKPYISGSNYILKMSDFEKGPWQTVWDGLFWRFMHEHRSFFTQNPRLGMLVGTFDKMAAEKQEQHLKAAREFLSRLDEGT